MRGWEIFAGIGAYVRRILASKRAYFAVLSNALVALTSFLLAVAIARQVSVVEFGQFTLCITIFLLAQGLIRASVTENTLAIAADHNENRLAFQRSNLLSMIAGLALLLTGLVGSLPYFVVLGIAFNGLAALDYLRTVNSALYRETRSLAQGIAWCAIAAGASLLTFFTDVPPLAVFGAWAIGGAAIGYFSLLFERYPLMPGWRSKKIENRAALLFSVDYLAGSGGALMSTSLLGLTAGPATVGAIRGGGTLLGPANLISGTVRSLAIPYLTRARKGGSGREFRSAVITASATSAILVPLVVVVAFLPYDAGEWLLGESFAVVAPVLPLLALESVLALVSSIPSAGHRSRLEGARALRLRLITGIPRPFLIVAAASQYGAVGAAWAMVIVAGVNAIVWWCSYWNLTRSRPTTEAR